MDDDGVLGDGVAADGGETAGEDEGGEEWGGPWEGGAADEGCDGEREGDGDACEGDGLEGGAPWSAEFGGERHGLGGWVEREAPRTGRPAGARERRARVPLIIWSLQELRLRLRLER